MGSFKFSRLGTHWQILTDGEEISPDLQKIIIARATDFEQHFSRFLDESEVSRINHQGPGKYRVSQELAEVLGFGLELLEKSEGYFNPAVATVLTAYGYDKNLKFKPNLTVRPTSGTISFSNQVLTLTGDAQLDLGGWGKGYLIDQLYELLLAKGCRHFLIDGGGDFRGTSKHHGHAWRIALEHPQKTDEAIGVVELKNSGLANSGVNKRRAGNFHHLIDFKSAQPVQNLLSSHVVAPTATIADGLATALLVSPLKIRQKLAKSYPIKYLLVDKEMRAEMSKDFQLLS